MECTTKQIVIVLAILITVINGAPLVKIINSTHNNDSSRCNCTLVEEDEPICGSNGLTYANEYELCVYNCEHNINITIKEHKECRNCTTYSRELQGAGASSGISSDILIRCSEGTQTLQDILSYPYEPICQSEPGKGHLFAPQQRNRRCGLYWCATPDGEPVQGTVSRKPLNCREGYCIDSNGVYRKNKETFKEDCGVCQCVNGKIVCINDYCTYEGASTLNLLKADLKIMFLLQSQFSADQRHSLDISLVYIRTTDIEFHNLKEVEETLEAKFNYYDRDHNERLSSTDRSFLIAEAFQLVKTNAIIDPLKQYLNTNNGGITKDEFINFFMTEHGEASGSLDQSAVTLS